MGEPRSSDDTQPTPTSGASMKKMVIRAVKVLVLAVIFYFLFKQFTAHWEQVRVYEWHINPLLLVMSLVVGGVTFVIMAAVWQTIMKAFQYQLSITAAFRIFYLSQLGRYVPGKVWALFGILYLAKQKGIPPEHAGASFVIVQLFAIPASFLVFALCAQLEPALFIDQISILGAWSSYLLTAGMILFSLWLVLFPGHFLAVGNRILRRFGRPEVHFQLDKRVALGIFVAYCFGWTCYGVAFWLFVHAIAPNTLLSPVAAVGLFNAAYQIGYLTLIAPGGFGPRELVMGTMLTPFVGPIGPAVAIAARLWAIVLEAGAGVAAMCIKK